MHEQVVIVTDPDDFIADGFRFMTVDLTESQTNLVSEALLSMSKIGRIICYSYKSQDSIDWFLDKKTKCDFVIFNAESDNQLLIGYLAAHKHSFYLGTLKSLSKANKSAIYSVEDVVDLLNFRMRNNETV